MYCGRWYQSCKLLWTEHGHEDPDPVFLPAEAAEDQEEEWTVYGSLCTVSDILLKKLTLPDAQVGDVLVFHNIGAYSVTEGIYLFLSRRMPKIFLYGEKDGLKLLRNNTETWMMNTWEGD